MAHIATLRKLATAYGYSIYKHSDGRGPDGVGYSEYTIAKNAPDQAQTEYNHEHAELLSLHGVSAELDRIIRESALGQEGKDTLNARFAFNSSQTGTPESRVEWQRESARLYAKARESLFALVDANRPAIDCPFNAILSRDLEKDLRARITMERDICFALIRAALDAGYYVTVYDGESCVLRPSNCFIDIVRELFHTDENFIEFRKGVEYIGSVSLIYGNDGFDVVSDYSAPLTHWQAMKDFMRPIAELADKLESEQ